MDQGTFELLIRAHQAELYRYARYLGADAPAAEDLVQDAFLVAAGGRMPSETVEPRVAAAWLRGVLRNLFLRHCRRRKISPVTTSSAMIERAEEAWRRDFLRADDGFDYTEALRKCVDELPPRARMAVELQYRERRSRADLAQALKISEDGVKSFMRRIRAGLAGCIRRRLLAQVP
jgi:RNA polymerase sigma factor (sigma-70 family)